MSDLIEYIGEAVTALLIVLSIPLAFIILHAWGI